MDLKFWLTNSRVYYMSENQHSENYDKAREQTLSDENVDETMPYINGNGRLCFIGNIYLFEMQNSNSWEDIDPADKYLNQDSYVMVNASDDYCNLRTGPGIKYDIINPIFNGTILPISETSYNQEDGNEWGKTSWI